MKISSEMGAGSSKTSSTNCFYRVDTSSWDVSARAPGDFSKVPHEVLMYLLLTAENILTPLQMGQTCRFFYTICKESKIWRTHVYKRWAITSPSLPPALLKQETWRDRFIRFDACSSLFRGFALDRATNEFLPYPMEINIDCVSHSLANTQVSQPATNSPTGTTFLDRRGDRKGCLQVDARCRWSTLRDSLTRIQGVIGESSIGFGDRFAVNRFLKTSNPRIFNFRETELLRGGDIAIPNNYAAMIVGPLMYISFGNLV